MLVNLPSPFSPPFFAIHLLVKNGSSNMFISAGSSDDGFLRFDVNNFTGLMILFTIEEIVFTGEETWSFKDLLGGGGMTHLEPAIKLNMLQDNSL